MSSTMAKYAVARDPSARSDMFRSYDTGVDHPQGNGHPILPSSSDIDNQDRISVQSAIVYRSIDSLAGKGSLAGVTSGSCAAGGASVGPAASSGKLTSLPASPFVRRASKSNSFSSHVRLHEKYGNSKKPLVLLTYLDAQEHLPYADDSTAVTPKSELNGLIVVDTPTRMNLARKFSYTSHTGKVDSYTSHTDLQYHPSGNGAASNTKENTLRKRMASLFSDMGQTHPSNKPSTPNSILMEPMSSNPYGPLGSCNSPKSGPSLGGLGANGKDSVDLQVGELQIDSLLHFIHSFNMSVDLYSHSWWYNQSRRGEENKLTELFQAAQSKSICFHKLLAMSKLFSVSDDLRPRGGQQTAFACGSSSFGVSWVP